MCSADALCSCTAAVWVCRSMPNPLRLNSTAGPLTVSLSLSFSLSLPHTHTHTHKRFIFPFTLQMKRFISRFLIFVAEDLQLCRLGRRPSLTCDSTDIKTKNSSSSINSHFIVQDTHWAPMIQHSQKSKPSCLLIWGEDQIWRARTAPIDYSNSGWVSLRCIP